MEKVEFTLINGKTRLLKRKLAEALEKRGKGYFADKEYAPVIDASDGAVELAAEAGIDLSTVEGSGKDGRILKRDLKGYNTRMMKAD